MGFKKDLPLTSSHWGTYRAKVNNGKVTELIGWENDKDPSPICLLYTSDAADDC